MFGGAVAAAWMLVACGAHSFTLGSAHTASASAGSPTTASAGPPTSTAGSSFGPPSSSSPHPPGIGSEVPVDETDPVTSGTIAANRGLTGPVDYPPGTDGPASGAQTYGPPGARRGPGYYEENAQRWTILAGFTVEEAKRRARATGFDGEILVGSPSEYHPECKAGTVCGVVPLRWQLNIEHTMTLMVNATLKISSPE
jgi:hypothetical protein